MKSRIRKAFNFGGQKHGGDNGQQLSSQQPQSQQPDSGSSSKARSTWRSIFSSDESARKATELITTSHARPPSQPDTVTVVKDTPVTTSGTPNSAADSSSAIPPGGPALFSSTPVASSATSAHAPIGLGCGDGVPPQEVASGGKPKDSASGIPVSNLQDSVATTIAPVNPPVQTEVSTPASAPKASSLVSQVANCSSDTKNNPTVSHSISAHLWQKALEIARDSLAKYELPSLEISSFQSQSAAENIQSLLAKLEAAQLENKDRQWRYKDRQGNEVAWVERLGKILKSVDKYAKIVDVAIQHHPDVTSLVWAGARTILQVTLSHIEAMECFEEVMVTIMDKMAVSAFYAGIYTGVELQTMGDIDKLYEILNRALPEFYATVIVFTVKARQYFEARWAKKAINMLKPFAIEFQPFIDDITRKEKAIKKCANIATMERIRKSSEKIAKMENLLIESKEILKCSLDEQLLELLSPLEPLKRHADVQSIRLEDTGTWLLELESFRKWCDIESTNGSERILCCYGMPGAGKTLIR
ncbi:hypothetical protein EV426DRAFT_188014 [Tirmania nivea]|nr:hypothetical protein EV426DRAFT_188014 [Tirmania nivea]